MIPRLFLKIVLPVLFFVFVYIALHSSNVPPAEREKVYIAVIAVSILIIIARFLSKVLNTFAIVIVIASVAMLFYFLYKYNSIPFIESSKVDATIERIGLEKPTQ